jgi:hypothetical protein
MCVVSKRVIFMDNIRFIGLTKIDDEAQSLVKDVVNEYYPKIKRLLKNEVQLVVHIKAHTKGGARPKFSLHVRAEAPTRIFESSKSAEWDLKRAVAKSMEDVIKEIQHAFHDDREQKLPGRKRVS